MASTSLPTCSSWLLFLLLFNTNLDKKVEEFGAVSCGETRHLSASWQPVTAWLGMSWPSLANGIWTHRVSRRSNATPQIMLERASILHTKPIFFRPRFCSHLGGVLFFGQKAQAPSRLSI